MCSNYLATPEAPLSQHFGVEPPEGRLRPEAHPGYFAPIIRPASNNNESDRLECVSACFGMVPHWADLNLAKRTYNARVESIAHKPFYRNPWRKRQFCIVPLEAFFESSYEAGKAVRWKIAHREGRPLGVAGIWECRPADHADGKPLVSFSLITIDAKNHPLMSRFNKQSDQQRMIVILDPQRYFDWLHTTPADAARFFTPYPADQLVAEPVPEMTARKAA
ncbi:MAG: SOS response-associated peptidase family protein [Pseudomonadota bacterium]